MWRLLIQLMLQVHILLSTELNTPRRSFLENKDVVKRFIALADCAAVMVNTSTRFTDGEQMGFGAEIGISNQKLHARGPMGLEAMTTTTWIVTGNGQIRS